MLALRSRQPANFSTRISNLSKKLRADSQQWDKISVNLKASARQVLFSDSDFGRAEDAAVQASHDTARTDSSWHGDRMEGGVQSGTRNLDWGDGLIRRSDKRLEKLKQRLSLSEQELNELLEDMAAAGDSRVPEVEAAVGSLEGSQRHFAAMKPEFKEFRTGARKVDRLAAWAGSDIEEVVADQPGYNVSRAARRALSRLREIGQEVDTLATNVASSRGQGSQGDQQLWATISHLDHAAGLNLVT